MYHVLYIGIVSTSLILWCIGLNNMVAIKDFLGLKLKLYLLEKLDVGTMKKLNGNVYEIAYLSGTSKYKITFTKKRGPSNYSKIIDENSNDVTSYIHEYAGPGHDFHGGKITPMILGKKKLIFTMKDGNLKIFNENDNL